MTIDTSTWPLPDRIIGTKKPGWAKFVAINDPHFCAHNPAVYKTDYWTLTKESLRKVFKFAKDQDADAILWSGDLFHLKAASRNPLWFISEILDLMREPQIPMIGIAGNHDIKFGSIEEGLEGQALDILIKAGVYHLLDRQEVVFDAGNHTTRVAGGSYRHAKAEYVRAKQKKGANRLITLGHFWYGPQSGEFFGEPIYGPDYLDTGETDLYIIGHHHEDQGVQTHGSKQYASVGSLSRTGSHKNDLERRPAALFVETTEQGITTKIVRPRVPAADEIMDLEKRAQVMQEKEEIQEFLTALNTAKLTTTDPRKILEELKPTDKVRERVLKYLSDAEAT